ncbi:DUF1499 domain-containing protein [Consotaella aegiceratis]|uniref:DUF1499 domain-containing protein n=1 Tax=Consotaella aegiceratis TaxID=3097961 RepID=UPI002F3FFB33
MSIAARYAGSRMAGHYLTRRLRAAGWAWRLATFSLILLPVTILLYRLGVVELNALFMLLGLTGGLAALALLLSLLVLQRVWRKGDHGGGRAVSALLLALLVLAPFVLAAALWEANPRVNWAVTGEEEAVPVGTIQARALGEIRTTGTASPDQTLSGRRFRASAAQINTVARDVLDAKGWSVESVIAGAPVPPEPASEALPNDLQDGAAAGGTALTEDDEAQGPAPDPASRPDAQDYVITAVARSPVFAFPSEIVIRIHEVADETRVEMRSTSLTLPYDLGQNARFIRGFLTQLDDAAAAVEGVTAAGG